MFSTFVNTLNTWIDENGKRPALDTFSCAHCDLVETPPDLHQIKRAFLTAIIPDSLQNLFKEHPNYLKYLVDTQFQFTAYITDAGIKSRVETGIFAMFSETEKQSLFEQLKAFLSHQNKWIDGSWHSWLLDDPKSAALSIFQSLEFKDIWLGADFLANCGYLVPFSKAAAKGWLKWSEGNNGNPGFNRWWDCLVSISEDRISAFKLDRSLDCLFNQNFTILSQPFCFNQNSCVECPLQSSCKFYQENLRKHLAPDTLNQIKTGDSKHIPTMELLRLIADKNWYSSRLQTSFIENFPGISHHQFSEVTCQDDEQILAKLLAAKELSERSRESDSPLLKKTFTNAREIYDHFKKELRKDAQESFYAVTLDNKHRVISKRLISLGTLNQSLVHPREVFATAIQLRAAAIILVHNHPSGDPTPSNQDLAITQRLQDVGDLVGIKVLDHIIIGADSFFSFVDENMLF